MVEKRLELLPSISNFVDVVSGGSKQTGQSYAYRLNTLNSFLIDTLKVDIDELVTAINSKQLDVYDTLAKYRMFLQSKNLSKATVLNRVGVAKTYLEYNGVSISNVIYKLKVRPGKMRKVELQALAKEDIRKILLGCQDVRLLTYVLLLASTGMRANEATSVRVKDMDFDKGIIELREEFTKTKQSRIVYLTKECMEQLKKWMEYRQRTIRMVDNYNRVRYVTRIFKDDELFFTLGRFKKQVEVPLHVYISLLAQFEKVLDKVGFSKRRENLGRQRKVTFHSFRRFVKSTISDLGYQDYSEWFIGHAGSTYYRKTEAEKLEIFKKVEPYLTFLDYSKLEAKGADTETKLAESQKTIEELRKQMVHQREGFREEMQAFKRAVRDTLKEMLTSGTDGLSKLDD